VSEDQTKEPKEYKNENGFDLIRIVETSS
jgi:hypothetical protein